jgi:hypothetical protein
MHDKTLSIHLLEYYSLLAAHHRVMMIGFGSVYFAINQAILLTPISTFQAASAKFPLAIVLSAGSLTVFVVAAMMHHACHFCSNAAMKAIMACDVHYQHLPKNDSEIDTFLSWVSRVSHEIRTFVAVPTASVFILATVFIFLAVTNLYIFLEIAKTLISGSHRDTNLIFGAFVLAQCAVGLYYGAIFAKHFRYFRSARKELALVLSARTQAAVDDRVRNMHSLPRTTLSTAWRTDV